MGKDDKKKERKRLRKPKAELTDITLYDNQGNVEKLYTKDMLEVIINTVAKGATPEELYMFLSVANQSGLNPFAREIWFIPMGSGDKRKIRIETSRDGYLKMAHSDPDFLGVQSAVVHANDTFTYAFGLDGTMASFNHEANGFDRGAIVGSWAVARHKTKGSFYAIIPMDEADKEVNAWQSNPSAMVMKVAEAFALKRIAGISGLVTGEEMGTDVDKVTKPNRMVKKTERKMKEYSDKLDETSIDFDKDPNNVDLDSGSIDAEYEVKSKESESEE